MGREKRKRERDREEVWEEKRGLRAGGERERENRGTEQG